MELATKWISRELAVAGGTIGAMVEAEQWEAAAVVAVGYAIGMGLQKAAEALGAAKYLGNLQAGIAAGVEAGEGEDS